MVVLSGSSSHLSYHILLIDLKLSNAVAVKQRPPSFWIKICKIESLLILYLSYRFYILKKPKIGKNNLNFQLRIPVI